jgi:rod shape-determining protein MreC
VKLALSGQPGGAEAVLVVLEGVHQEIPTGPAMADVHVAPLPLPPGQKDNANAAVEQVQTEADKIVGKYQALGKEENHVYGAVGSGVPNFNPAKSAAVPTAAAVPATAVAPAVQTPASTPLPLGSPRKKAAADAPPPSY